MNEPLHLTIQVPVSLNDYLKVRGIKKGNFISGMMYESAEAKKYKVYFADELRKAVEKVGWETEHDHNHFYIVETVVYFNKQNRDSNNIWKLMIDAITDTQLIWLDDRQCIERCKRIYYDSKNPRLELTIRQAPFVGVFDSEELYQEFIDTNCSDCTRYKNNCSILRSAEECRITEEIDLEDFTCNSKKVTKQKAVKKKN